MSCNCWTWPELRRFPNNIAARPAFLPVESFSPSTVRTPVKNAPVGQILTLATILPGLLMEGLGDCSLDLAGPSRGIAEWPE
jgi:hypothetical protein